MKQPGCFTVAGSLGFVTGAGMLTLLLATTPLEPFTARIGAMAFSWAYSCFVFRKRE